MVYPMLMNKNHPPVYYHGYHHHHHHAPPPQGWHGPSEAHGGGYAPPPMSSSTVPPPLPPRASMDDDYAPSSHEETRTPAPLPKRDSSTLDGDDSTLQDAPHPPSPLLLTAKEPIKYRPKVSMSPAAKAPHKKPALAMKSPITMCFERMLGAADLIATVPSAKEPNLPKHQIKLSSSKPRAKRKLLSADLTQDDIAQLKKIKKEQPMEPLGPGNPFYELEQDEELRRQVVLKMALQRQVSDNDSPRPLQQQSTLISPVIKDGFFWRDYPACEQVLYDNMADYYDVSSGQRQSKSQQSFNNMLVKSVRWTAKAHGLSFDPTFNDKKLRDRIRCFYKTHLQNAKKRLSTMEKHYASRDHQTALQVYLRSVREGISVEESERLEPTLRKKYQRASTVAAPESEDDSE